MKTDLASIYERELQKLHDKGWEPSTHERVCGWTIKDGADARASEIYDKLVDRGCQRAKDREIEARIMES